MGGVLERSELARHEVVGQERLIDDLDRPAVFAGLDRAALHAPDPHGRAPYSPSNSHSDVTG